METLFRRYRNISILVVAILTQLVGLAYQVKTNQEMRLIRVWAATAVSPMVQLFEGIRTSVRDVAGSYIALAGAQAENRRFKEELGKLKLENQYLRSELETAQRAEALQAFQKKSPSKTLAARVIGSAAGVNSRMVFVDRGSSSGVMRGMAVLTPDGIVGKVTDSYPTASTVQLITDPEFAVGVISQKSRVVGTLKGQGRSTCIVDYVQVEQPVEAGEWFYTSGDDRIFPKGLPVGQVSAVREGRTFKEIFVDPAGFATGLDEVLIVVEGVHQQIPSEDATSSSAMQLLPPPPGVSQDAATADAPARMKTDADRLKEKYREMGEAANYKFGEGMSTPDLTRKPAAAPAAPRPAPQKPPAPAP